MTQRFHHCQTEPLCGWCRAYDDPDDPAFREKWDREGAARHAAQVAAGPAPPAPAAPGLGDVVAAALAAAGLTSERVSAWLGAPCNCAARQARLNALGRWAQRVLTRPGR